MPALTVPASIEQLALVNDYVKAHVPDAFQGVLDHVLLAAEELLVNVFTYAYGDGQGQAEVNCRLVSRDGSPYLCLTIKDWGPPFDPFSQAPVPDLNLGIEDRPIGGLGIHLITSVAAHVRYKRQDDANVVDLYFAQKP